MIEKKWSNFKNSFTTLLSQYEKAVLEMVQTYDINMFLTFMGIV